MGKEKKMVDIKYIESFKCGNLEAFNHIYEFYKDRVYFFAFSIVKSKADAEDIMQEVFIKVMKSIQDLKDVESFNAWINTITYSKSLDYIKKHKRLITMDDELFFDYQVDPKANTISQIQNQDVHDTIKGEVKKLPAKLLQVAQLFYLEGLSAKEISEIIQVPLSTVYERKTTVQKLLKEGLEKKGFSPNTYLSVGGIPILFKIFQELSCEYGLSSSSSSRILLALTNSSSSTVVGTTAIKTSFIITHKVAIGIAIAVISVTAVGAKLLLDQNDIVKNMDKPKAIYEKKHRTYEYIKDITYGKAISRTKVLVEIGLLNRVREKDILITKNNKIIEKTLVEDKIVFDAYENGEYKIRVKDDEKTILITNINPEAFEVTGASMYDTYMQLKIDDPFHRIDYQKSYAIMNEEKIEIDIDGKINRATDQQVKVYLYDVSGSYIQYTVEI